MKVLLTGANGFVGSHILDSLRARGIDTTVLLRPASDRHFIEAHLPHIAVHHGSISDPESLYRAMAGATHVIHCAGSTKALRTSDFFDANQTGTRNVVDAVNRRRDHVQRLVHISSLAVAGPATRDQPARELDPPAPVSDYGRSKLAGEQEVQHGCQAEFVILRPPAVYGPRDREFLRLFKAVKAHLLPRFGGGLQVLSLVYVKDLAEAVIHCLTPPAAAGHSYFVASPEPVTARAFANAIALQMNAWTVPLPLPTAILWIACVWQEAVSRFTGKPNVLSRQKYAELRAAGWVCDAARLRDETDFICSTPLNDGLAITAAWYQREGWL